MVLSKLVENYAKEYAEKEKNARVTEIALELLKAGKTVTFVSKITKLASGYIQQLAVDNGIRATL